MYAPIATARSNREGNGLKRETGKEDGERDVGSGGSVQFSRLMAIQLASLQKVRVDSVASHLV